MVRGKNLLCVEEQGVGRLVEAKPEGWKGKMSSRVRGQSEGWSEGET
jgi:hypothetical protein